MVLTPKNQTSESLAYLENFWVPNIGASVSVDGVHGRIHSFASAEQTQVLLEVSGSVSPHVFFIQDLNWAPLQEDIATLFKGLGFVDCGDAWYLDGVYYPHTDEIEIASRSLMQARARRLEFPAKDLVFI